MGSCTKGSSPLSRCLAAFPRSSLRIDLPGLPTDADQADYALRQRPRRRAEYLRLRKWTTCICSSVSAGSSPGRLLAIGVQPLTQGSHRGIRTLFARSRAGAVDALRLVEQAPGIAARSDNRRRGMKLSLWGNMKRRHLRLSNGIICPRKLS